MISKEEYDELASRPSWLQLHAGQHAAREDERTHGVAARALHALIRSMRFDGMRQWYTWDERAVLDMPLDVAGLIQRALRSRAPAQPASGAEGDGGGA